MNGAVRLRRGRESTGWRGEEARSGITVGRDGHEAGQERRRRASDARAARGYQFLGRGKIIEAAGRGRGWRACAGHGERTASHLPAAVASRIRCAQTARR